MRRMAPAHLMSVVLATIVLTAAAPCVHAQDRWQWDVAPYIWASSISEDLILDGEVVGGGDTSFKDLVDLTESSYLIHLETIGESIGFFFDGMSIELSDQEVGQLLQTDVEITEKTTDAGIMIRPAGRGGKLDLFLGLRVISLDERYLFTLGENDPFEVRIDESYWDALFGLRYNHPLGERWLLSFRGDVSFGGTDGTWTIQAAAGWLFGASRRHAVIVGYRHRNLEYEKGRVLDVERTLSGPVLGVNFGF